MGKNANEKAEEKQERKQSKGFLDCRGSEVQRLYIADL